MDKILVIVTGAPDTKSDKDFSMLTNSVLIDKCILLENKEYIQVEYLDCEAIGSKRYSRSMNEIISQYKDIVKYVCVLPINIILGEGAIEELLFWYKKIENSGVISIPTKYEELWLSPFTAVDSDKVYPLWVNGKNYVEGVLFFSVATFYALGCYDETVSDIEGFEDRYLCYMAGEINKDNYYIVDACCCLVVNNNILPAKTAEKFNNFKKIVEDNFKKDRKSVV